MWQRRHRLNVVEREGVCKTQSQTRNLYWTEAMKLTLISLLSLTIGLFLGYSALFTAKQIAKATMPRIEIALDQ